MSYRTVLTGAVGIVLAIGLGIHSHAAPPVDADPTAVAHYNKGVSDYEENRYNSAADEFRTAIHIDPDFAEAHANLGLVLRGSDQDAAIQQLRTATRIKPDLAEAHNTLGALLYRQQQFDAAASEYRTVLRLHPDSAAAHYNLGIALAEMDQPKAVVAEFTQAVKLRPGFTDARIDLGQALYQAGRRDEARAQWHTVAASGDADAARSARRLLAQHR